MLTGVVWKHGLVGWRLGQGGGWGVRVMGGVIGKEQVVGRLLGHGGGLRDKEREVISDSAVLRVSEHLH